MGISTITKLDVIKTCSQDESQDQFYRK